MNRRDFLTTVPLARAASALPASDPLQPAAETPVQPFIPPAGDLDFASALQAAAAIRKKQVSSVELTRRVFERIDRYNPQLNAFAYQLREDAMASAKKADETQTHARSSASFHRLPFPLTQT